MLFEIRRFNSIATQSLNDPSDESQTVLDYLERNRLSRDFRDFYLIPMSSAVWSTPPDQMLQFPAVSLIRFFHHHGFLGMHTQHPWFTIDGGAKTYVEKLMAPFLSKVMTRRRVQAVTRTPESVTLKFQDGAREDFDKVIFACHADQALNLLSPPKAEEEALLKPFKYQTNPAALHTDSSVMPKERLAWASWNVRIGLEGEPSTHYWMNSLQSVSQKKNYFVSLNTSELAPLKTLKKITFEHPVFNLETIRAQMDLHALNLRPLTRIYFCGSYFRYGFHEDAFTSSLELARIVLRKPIWQ